MNALRLDDPGWSDFVLGHPRATLFHHPAWASLLADCYGYRASALVLSERGGVPTAGLPVIDVSGPVGGRRWVSLPFTDACAAITDDPAASVDALMTIARERRLDALEVRGDLGAHDGVQARTAFVRHELALSDQATMWQGLRANHRRNIRTAERAGVRVVRGHSPADVEAFYGLHLRTRRRLGVPVQPRRFFELLLQRMIVPGLSFVLTAYVGETPAASAIFGYWNGVVTYKYGARDERLDGHAANHLLFWTAMLDAREAGARAFDFGRSDVGQSQLRSFKTGWGAREESLSYSWITRREISPATGRAERALGVVIRHSSPWVCRALGELLYRYAA